MALPRGVRRGTQTTGHPPSLRPRHLPAPSATLSGKCMNTHLHQPGPSHRPARRNGKAQASRKAGPEHVAPRQSPPFHLSRARATAVCPPELGPACRHVIPCRPGKTPLRPGGDPSSRPRARAYLASLTRRDAIRGHFVHPCRTNIDVDLLPRMVSAASGMFWRKRKN